MKLSREEKKRRLTWKYFWEQKIKEVLSVLGWLGLFIAIPFLLGQFIGDNIDMMCTGDRVAEPLTGGFSLLVGYKCGIIERWIEGIIYCVPIGTVIFFMTIWIKGNWRKAKERAEIELGEGKKWE